MLFLLTPTPRSVSLNFFLISQFKTGRYTGKSNQLENPAAHLVVTSKAAGKDFDVWFPEMDGIGDNAKAPYQFQATDLKMGYFTGLQVSHEPGQWGVWGGVVLMVVGLAFVFYVVHVRIWVVPVSDPQNGKHSLWIGGSVNRNRDAFEERFTDLVAAVAEEMKSIPKTSPSEKVAVVAGD